MKRASAQAIVSLCNAKRAIVAADESAFDCHGSVAKRKATTHCTWGIERDGLGGVRVLSVDRVTDARRGNGEDADDTRTDAEKEQDMNDLLVLFHMLKTDRVLAHVFVVMALASKERCRSSTPQTSSFMTNYCARRIASAPSFRLLHFVLTNMTSIAANEELVARFPVIINVCSVMHRYFSCGVASCQQRNDFDFFLKESGDTDVACTVQIAESPTQPGCVSVLVFRTSFKQMRYMRLLSDSGLVQSCILDKRLTQSLAQER